MKEEILKVKNPLQKRENLQHPNNQKIKKNLLQASREAIFLEENLKLYRKEKLTKKNKRMVQLIKQILNRMLWMLNKKVTLNQKKERVEVVKALKIQSRKITQNLNLGNLKKWMIKKHLILNHNKREEKLQLLKKATIKPLNLKEEAQEN